MTLALGLVDVRCIGCRRWGYSLCPPCLSEVTSAPISQTIAGTTVVALGSYRGVLRTVIRSIKFSRSRSLVKHLEPALAELGRPFRGAIAIPIPPSGAGFASRGFRLTRSVARATGLVVEDRFRLNDSGQQHRRGRRSRLHHRVIAFDAHAVEAGTRFVIVDDVITTGATITAAIDACRRAGAAVVGVIALAATPKTATRGRVLGNVVAAV